MANAPTPNGSSRSRPLVGIAAVIAAIALLIFAIAFLMQVLRPSEPAAPAVTETVTEAGGYPGQPPAGVADAGSPAGSDAAGSGGDVDEAPPPGTAPTAAPGYPPGADDGAVGAGAPAFAGAEVVSVLEDWRDYADVDALEAAIDRNLGSGDGNSMQLLTLPADAVPGSVGGVGLEYVVGEPPPHDFVGYNRDLAQDQDWRGATHLAVWVEPDARSDQAFVVQWREDGSGEVWRYEGATREIPADGLLLIPLTAEGFQRALWSGYENDEIDLSGVDQYGLYAGHVGPGVEGTLIMGPIAAVRVEE